MPIRTILTLSTIFLTATLVLYLSTVRRQPHRIRVFVAKGQDQSEAEAYQMAKYLRTACPDIALVTNENRADYTLMARWYDPASAKGSWTNWVVLVSGKGAEQIFLKQGSPDAIETFREGCAAIRDDTKELAEVDATAPHTHTGRYSFRAADAAHVFLIDTETGAVWQLKELGRLQTFERVSVEGLYNNNPLGVMP